jgi:hemerythrin
LENAEIDAEHKQLIRIANSLLRAMQEGRNKNDFAKILHELREYTVFHFNNEEEYMRSIGYPDLNKHVEEHNILKKRVKDFQHCVFIGDKVEYDALREMLKDWLVGHILSCDLRIKEYQMPKNVEQEG